MNLVTKINTPALTVRERCVRTQSSFSAFCELRLKKHIAETHRRPQQQIEPPAAQHHQLLVL